MEQADSKDGTLKRFWHKFKLFLVMSLTAILSDENYYHQ